ncbi:MAG TPA: metallophosphoesterase [Solirubrobacteraceae bacterium]|jgi:predicted phosphodiesterase|nr:metallophosphoesterase [Solirubrobacteraceae bacterium]
MPRALIVLLVILATVASAGTAMATFHLDRDLDVGRVRLSVEPLHRGALDLYVPLVDWGVRFPVVRLPARVSVDVRSIDRDAVVRLAEAGTLDVQVVREQARDALASYLRLAILVATLAGLAFGLLVALAVRGGAGPRLRLTIATALVTSIAVAAALVVGLPPRSNVDSPQYYANGPEVPAALRTLESLGASSRTLDDEIDEQLVGIARLVVAPANRAPLGSRSPRLTVASDLHNNVIALPALERAARGGPLLFAGDLTDKGSAIERALVLRVVRAGRQLVFVSGNHDSDTLERQLAGAGAIVLTGAGRLHGDGSTGPLVVRVGGLRIAGYDDPLKRLEREDYEDRGATPTDADRQAFAAWLQALRDMVDVVMVHAPGLAQLAVDALRADPSTAPLVIVWGHTHQAQLRRYGTLTTLNPGSLGGGGTGNLAEAGGDIGLARLIYDSVPSFAPRAADLVQIDPEDGSAQAQRHRLDEPVTTLR